MNSRIRRRRVNYLLPSEGKALFERLIGKPFFKFRVGICGLSSENSFKKIELEYLQRNLYEFYTGPFFISCEIGTTLIIYEDDFLGSLVIRECKLDLDDPQFFSKLRMDDHGLRSPVSCAFDLMPKTDFNNKIIRSIAVFKLPVNFYGEPNTYDLLGECVLSLKFSDSEEILFACEIKQANVWSDLRVTTWDMLDEPELNNLACIYTLTL